MNEEIKFSEKKDDILKALRNKYKNAMWITENVTLIDWFFMQPVSDTFNWNIIIGGPQIPMIGLIWNESGRVYFIALKALLPEIY